MHTCRNINPVKQQHYKVMFCNFHIKICVLRDKMRYVSLFDCCKYEESCIDNSYQILLFFSVISSLLFECNLYLSFPRMYKF